MEAFVFFLNEFTKKKKISFWKTLMPQNFFKKKILQWQIENMYYGIILLLQSVQCV